ncbi:MAG: transposase [Alphaproteobacteria bacterium]|nr:transposase [Alphaproteobacteria bacterium]
MDPGMADAATASNGLKCPARRYRALETAIGIQQRARNKARVRALHAKVRNRRKNDAHVFSRAIVNTASSVTIGAWKPPTSGKSRWAKSARDGALASLKGMLKYKCEHASIPYTEISEAWSSQTCSSCGSIPATSPKGRAGLGVRHWTCDACGAAHDRDINAAINILHAGAACCPHETENRDSV